MVSSKQKKCDVIELKLLFSMCLCLKYFFVMY
jgi:hypothetical protein